MEESKSENRAIHVTATADMSGLGDKQSAKGHLDAAYAILDAEMVTIPGNQTEAARSYVKSALELLADRDVQIAEKHE